MTAVQAMRDTLSRERRYAATLLVALGEVLAAESTLDGERADAEARRAGTLAGWYWRTCERATELEDTIAWARATRERLRRVA